MLTPLEATQTSATHYDTKLIEDFISELLFRTILVHIAGNAADPSICADDSLHFVCWSAAAVAATTTTVRLFSLSAAIYLSEYAIEQS